jgi:ribosomal protein RSM22 (predicted rRNA methylase)
VQLRLCTHEGLVARAVAARDKANYKAARKKKWGQALP